MKQIVSDFLESINARIEKENQKINQAKEQIAQTNRAIEECMENIAFYENQKQLTLMQSSESHPISQLAKPAVHRKQKPDVYELYRKVFCSIKEQVKRIDMPDPANSSEKRNEYLGTFGRPYTIGVCINTHNTNTLSVYVKFNKESIKWFDHFKTHKAKFKKNIDKSIDFRETGKGRKIELVLPFDPTNEEALTELASTAAKTVDALHKICTKYEQK